MDKTSETMNTVDVALMLETTPETVCRYARTGELPGTRIGKGWIFLREDVVAFLKARIDRDTQRRLQLQARSPKAVMEGASKKVRNSRRTVVPSLPQLP